MKNILGFIVWFVKRNAADTVFLVSVVGLVLVYLLCDEAIFKRMFLLYVGVIFGWCGMKLLEDVFYHPIKLAYKDYIEEKQTTQGENKCK